MIPESIINQLCLSACTDTAVLLYKIDCHIGSNESNYYERKESNGNLVFLIIRDNRPITIMYRRDNQNNTIEGLRVNLLVDLSTDLRQFIKVNKESIHA